LFPVSRSPTPTSTPFPYTTLFRSAFEAVTFWTPDLTNDPRLPHWSEGHRSHETVQDRAVLAVPLPSEAGVIATLAVTGMTGRVLDRKSTRLNSSHGSISYAVFCLK